MTNSTEWLYGRQAVREMLRARRRRVQRILLAKGSQRTGIVAEIMALAQGVRCPVGEGERPALDQVTAGANHQGVAAEVSAYPYAEMDAILAAAGDDAPLLLALDHVQDPQNLGTLLRTADAAGVHGVLLPERRAAGITATVSNASAGAVEHLRIAQVINLTRTLQDLKAQRLWVAGLEVDPRATPFDRANLTGPLVLVVGSEGEGLSRLVRETCDWLISLPMHGHVESLNVAVAGSIVLYAAQSARRSNPQGQSGQKER
jgi:23S rRNA (guanosine2251-2'-O)-methyltransferase